MLSRFALSARTGWARAAMSSFRRQPQNTNSTALLVGSGVLAAAGLTAVTVAAADSTPDYAKVRQDIADILDQETWDDGSLGPVLVRLAWHSSGSYDKDGGDFMGGSNGATMRFAPEIKHGGNAGLYLAQKWLETVKRKHPAISYADLWILAGCVAIEEMGGPIIPFTPGRTDSADGTTPGDKAPTPDGRLPDAAQGAQHLRDVFYRMGFNDQEIVALSGAHALGRCHTTRSGFDGPWTRSPTTFSNDFFCRLLEEKWVIRQNFKPTQFQNGAKDLMMLPTDMALMTDDQFRPWVEKYAADEQLFFKHFQSACTKLFHNGCPKSNGWKRYLFASSRHC